MFHCYPATKSFLYFCFTLQKYTSSFPGVTVLRFYDKVHLMRDDSDARNTHFSTQPGNTRIALLVFKAFQQCILSTKVDYFKFGSAALLPA